jgi:hypothetical protein
VIVECWRYRYDAASATLRAERIASASVSPEVRP